MSHYTTEQRMELAAYLHTNWKLNPGKIWYSSFLSDYIKFTDSKGKTVTFHTKEHAS